MVSGSRASCCLSGLSLRLRAGFFVPLMISPKTSARGVLVVAQRSRAGFEGVGPVVSRDLTGDQAPSGRRGNGPL